MLSSDSDALSERESALQANDLLALAPAPLLHDLALHATECTFAPGEFVYGRDEVAQDLFVLLEGRVAYPEFIGWIKEEEAPDLRIASRCGQAFGFAGALMGYERRAVSAICERPTRVLRLSGQSIAQACTAYGRTGILEDLVRAHVRYERLGDQRGWQRLRGHQWSIVQAPLSESLRPIAAGGICVLVMPEDSTAAAGLWREALALGAISVPAAVEADGAVQTPALQNALAGKRGEQAKRTVEKLFDRFALTSLFERGPQAWNASERLQLQLLETWFSDAATSGVALGDELSVLEGGEREPFFEFARRVGREFRTTLYVAFRDLDEAFAVGDRVILPQRGSASGPCIAIDLMGEQRNAGKRPRALRSPDQNRDPSRTTAATATATARPVTAPVIAKPKDRCRNRLWEDLQSKNFFWTVEFIPSHEKPLRGELERLSGMSDTAAPSDDRMAGFAVTDRVHSDYDPDPVSAALYLKERCQTQPLVHLSGKGRELYDLNEALCRVDAFGLENVLLLTGDRLKNEPHHGPRTRYLESVCAIQTARKAWPQLHIGVALNPFKYREEDAMAQYLKLGKKLGSGADFIITQLGYDMDKYDEARSWMEFRGYSAPLIGNLMLLNAARGRWIRRQRVPGIVISDSLQALLEEEERSFTDKGRGRALDRLAMQMVGLRLKGFNGIQLTGVHDHKQLRTLGEKVERFSQGCDSEERWQREWKKLLTAPDSGHVADPAPFEDGWRWRPERVQAHGHASARYRIMDRVHRSVFDQGPIAGILGGLVRNIRPDGVAGRLLKNIEAGIKGPLFGCESCGMCRLAATQYVCPETCPKGLANGPCGGTDSNLCEFGDRECIHSRKYRIARDAGVLNQLETWIVPAVPAARRGTPSWPAHFSGSGPQIEVVTAAAKTDADHRN